MQILDNLHYSKHIEKEIYWKDIIDYEGCYQINKNGQIKSLYNNIIIKPHIFKERYPIVTLNKNGIKTKFYVHRLVAKHFLKNYTESLYVCHIDNNKQNYCVENLYMGTQKENMADKIKFGTNKQGVDIKNSKLKEVDVINIRNLFNGKKLNQRELSEKFKVTQSVISEIVNNKSWKHVK